MSITNSQKEERKRKLKEIAQKGKGESKEELDVSSSNVAADLTELPSVKIINSNKTTNVKVTSSNRQAFLTEGIKSANKKESPRKSSTSKGKKESSSPKEQSKVKSPEQSDNIENTKKPAKKTDKESKSKSTSSKSKEPKSKSTDNTIITEIREPLKSLKPLIATQITKVDPQPQKKKKTVRFSEDKPEIHYFEIEDGNRMKKTSSVRTSLVDIRHMPIFSLEKITLMKILRWNPHWLEEQINNNEPPPILGHSNPPLTIFHMFNSHNQYVQ